MTTFSIGVNNPSVISLINNLAEMKMITILGEQKKKNVNKQQSPYNSKFVKQILEQEKMPSVKIKTADLWK
ncbi:MAG: hypothetical protein LBQ31_10915 [Bacteroidales bacterium]|jgi:hypothetical protein|nr:hypothetical protein [Bacteroidales bacterium]